MSTYREPCNYCGAESGASCKWDCPPIKIK